MSLVAVYDALKAANVDDAKATAAVEAIEAVREESRLRRIEERIGELKVEIGEVRAEIGEVRAEIKELRADTEKSFGEVRAEIREIRAEMKSEILLLRWMCGGILGLMAMAFIRIMFG